MPLSPPDNTLPSAANPPASSPSPSELALPTRHASIDIAYLSFVIIFLASIILSGICFLVCVYKRKKRKLKCRDAEAAIVIDLLDDSNSLQEWNQSNTNSENMFTYEDLAKATDNFSSTNLLGQGGFGYVHKGVLEDGTEVAIKQLKDGSGQGEREFQAELQTITRVHHRHLVSVLGFCITGSQRLLVYEFVSNNTLQFHLHEKGRPVMEWEKRMKIAFGAAKGLSYLHDDCKPKTIHRDVKAANILIDESYEAKLADFGLARCSLDTDTHVSTRIMGTVGYLAPEYASSGKLTDKSDVFSFGVVLLELITGRRPVHKSQPSNDDDDDSIVDWAKPLMIQALNDGNFDGLVDPGLEGNFDITEMTRMVACAAASVRYSAKRRPKMSQIVRVFEGNISLEDLTEGATPVHNSICSLDGSLDYSTTQYIQDMKNFERMALESQTFGGISECSGLTTHSDNGQNPPGSSRL